MLYVGVVLWGIRDDMVDIMVPLPPPNRQAAAEVGDDDSDDAVDMEMVGDTNVASIMSAEDKLVPKCAQADCTQGIPSPPQKK